MAQDGDDSFLDPEKLHPVGAKRPALEPGTRLGAYEILAPLGAGGMGEVYRARDAKLRREVAIKVLPRKFSRDKERLERFQREAQLLAQLNHTNIATLYGLEEQDGQLFLVMELVEGETLAERIARGAIAVDEAVPLFIQIAEGLEAAHEKGIIHRDLKPANIKIGHDGKPKILDFGLAKAFTVEVSASSLSQSPTMTKGTATGVILGTAPYMSPEQARGQPVDKRTDIFAYGAVLFEALTGKKAFPGEDVSEVLAGVLKDDPQWDLLPSHTPPRLEELVRRSLAKDPRYRLRDIGEAWFVLGHTREDAVPANGSRRPGASLLLGGFLVLAIVLLVGRAMRPAPPASETVRQLTVKLSPSQRLYPSRGAVTVSPNGTSIAYVTRVDGQRRLVLRGLDALEGRVVDGTEDAYWPFFSPDGHWIGLLTYPETASEVIRGMLKKIPVEGGPSVDLARWSGEKIRGSRGAGWGDDDFIVFPSEVGAGLSRVSVSSAKVEVLTPPAEDGSFQAEPHVLPGSRSILFQVGKDDKHNIAILSLDSGEQEILIEGGTFPRYVTTGHIVYSTEDALMAVPFDLDELTVTGPAVTVTENVGSWLWSFSKEGTLVYRAAEQARSLVWVNRRGEERTLPIAPRRYYVVRISPDGSRVALNYENSDIWMYEFARQVLTRFTSGPSNSFFPLWKPDGLRVAFVSRHEGPLDLYWKNTDGSQVVERLATSPNALWPYSWSPDGKNLIFEEATPEGSDIGMLSMEVPRTRIKVVDGPFDETGPVVSPDGRWIAYESNESGRIEVYVRAFPRANARWQVSTEGGTVPLWNPKGNELFYRNGNDMMAVPMTTTPGFAPGKPELLFSGNYYSQPSRAYDIAPDGERFLMVKRDDDENTELHIVLNWFQLLERLVPTEH